jgi:L-methionine (R)-S-oxide reductase
MTATTKQQRYQQATRTIAALIDGEQDLIAVMSTIACELYHAFDTFNWVGFYRRVDPTTLKVGPYQGSHGCLSIDIKRGVCGACVREAAFQLVNDVTEIADHIACSCDTKAELALPILDAAGYVVAVLDIDSVEKEVFDEVDITHLTTICQWLSARL